MPTFDTARHEVVDNGRAAFSSDDLRHPLFDRQGLISTLARAAHPKNFTTGGQEEEVLGASTWMMVALRSDIVLLEPGAARGSRGHGRQRRKVGPPPPDDRGLVRVVEIVGLDRQAWGGTHLASTVRGRSVRILNIDTKGRHNGRVYIGLSALGHEPDRDASLELFTIAVAKAVLEHLSERRRRTRLPRRAGRRGTRGCRASYG